MYKISSWTTLVEYSERLGHAFLPNLQQLRIHCDECPTVDRINWIGIFLAPSLLDIEVFVEITDGVLEIPDSRAAALLELIIQYCPSVRFLSIFPESDDHFQNVEQDIVPFASSMGFYEHVANMGSLRTLTMSKSALQPDAILYVGLLPALEKLIIHGSSKGLIPTTLLPEYLFPSLRHLTLHILESIELCHIWQMQILVRQLTHVQINSAHSEVEIEENDEIGLICRLPELFGNSPHVRTLSINFDAIPDLGLDLQCLDASELTTVFQLPLTCLILENIEFGVFEDFCEHLAESCPNLCQLGIPNQWLPLSELHHLTHLKQLERLNARVAFLGLPKENDPSWGCSANALKSLEYNSSDSDDEESDPNITATDIAV